VGEHFTAEHFTAEHFTAELPNPFCKWT